MVRYATIPLTSAPGAESEAFYIMMNIQINQLGYTGDMQKIAVMRGRLADRLEVLDASGRAVMELPVMAQAEEIWGDQVALADFSPLCQPGEYTLRCGEEQSYPFVIAAQPYQACLTALVDMFYYQRCGCEVDARAGVFAHPACHAAPARVWDTREYRDVHGGWHDAGDFGRYIVPAAKAAADLLLAWQWNPAAFASPGLTELREEVRWELEWMLRMQREDGGVYHKVSCASFCGMIMPHEEKEELVISPVSTTATGDFAACMALASRFYRALDADFAHQMAEAARRAWDFMQAHEPMLFTNPQGISTGGYGDRSDADERLWAHVELALTFGEEKYLRAAEEAIRRAEKDRAPLGWGDMRGYAALSGMALPGEMARVCREWVIGAARESLKRLNAYGITMTERLPWGSNMNIANDGVIFAHAWLLTGEADFLQAAQRQLHYLLGVNPVGYCYVSCFGSQPMLHPHHRPSVAKGVCQPGMLSGGAASGMMDPCAREHLQGQPAGKSFIDRFESYSTNEICVYWNSPMVALLALLTSPKC